MFGSTPLVSSGTASVTFGSSSGAAKPLEKRTSPDGNAYTKAEFGEFFGGTAEWDAAAPVNSAPNRMSTEKRTSPDGNAYTEAEFVTFFGGTREWDAAKPKGAAVLSATLERDLARVASGQQQAPRPTSDGLQAQKARGVNECAAMATATAGMAAVKSAKEGSDMDQVREYMEVVTGESWKSDDMWESLKDGIYLCKFINAVAPGSVPSINKIGVGRFAIQKEMENITFFCEACVKFGLRQNNTFRPPDLYEKRVSYPKAIIDCILAVKRVAEKGSTVHTSPKWNNDVESMKAEQAALRRKLQTGGASTGDTDAKSRDQNKALSEATRSVASVKTSQEQANMDAARIWIEEVTGRSWPSNDLWEATKDGVLLCELVNIIKPEAVVKVNRPGKPFQEMENLTYFIGACKVLGVRDSDTFRPPDLFEKRVSYPKAIIDCIHALSKVSRKCRSFNGPYLTVQKVGMAPAIV